MSDSEIKISILQCGSILVSPTVPYGNGVRLTDSFKQVLSPVGTRVELPVFCFLIEHPKGLILVDTGWCREFSPEGVYDAKAVKRLLPDYLASFYHPLVKRGEAVHERLQSLGIRPEDLDYVIITHLDPDHVSGIRHLQGAKRILLSEDEYFWSCRTVYKARQPWNLWFGYPIERFWYRGSPIGPANWSYDLFGDESVILVNCPGHTDGMATVLVRNHGRFVLLASDAAYSSRNWENMVIPGFGFDTSRMMKSLSWVKQQAEDPLCIAVLCSHDPAMTPHTVTF